MQTSVVTTPLDEVCYPPRTPSISLPLRGGGATHSGNTTRRSVLHISHTESRGTRICISRPSPGKSVSPLCYPPTSLRSSLKLLSQLAVGMCSNAHRSVFRVCTWGSSMVHARKDLKICPVGLDRLCWVCYPARRRPVCTPISVGDRRTPTLLGSSRRFSRRGPEVAETRLQSLQFAVGAAMKLTVKSVWQTP